MSDELKVIGAKITTPMFPITVRQKGQPIAILHADGRLEGNAEALSSTLKAMQGEPDSNGFTLFFLLHALLNQKIIGMPTLNPK